MIIDVEDRIVRYVKLNTTGVPIAENLHTGPSRNRDGSSRSEDDYFAEVVAAAALKGHTIVRLCNHEDNCRNPMLEQIESDGNGGVRVKPGNPEALNGVEFWNPGMERAFLVVTDERGEFPVQRVVRFEPGEWEPGMKGRTIALTNSGIEVR